MSNKLYTSIPAPKVKRNTFNLSRYNSLTIPYQRVCPTAVQEILPGDIFRWDDELFCRTQPMVAPVMTDQKISQHAFFVPLRTLNKHFSEFMFNNKSGNYTDVLPYVSLGWLYSVVNNSGFSEDLRAEVIRLYDYMNLPFSYRSATTLSTFVSQWISDNIALKDSTLRVNLLPFFAYTKIWSEYFRDENLVSDPFEVWTEYGYTDIQTWVGSRDTDLAQGTKKGRFAECFLKLRPRAWQHDRFTSCLPFAQRGPDVLLPVTGSVTVNADGPSSDGDVEWRAASGDNDGYLTSVASDPGGDSGDIVIDAEIDGISTTINDFRRAERLQRWFENSARGGVRQNEATLAHFGVRTKDATLDRAEFLGGNMQPIVVSEVPQTSETSASSPQGSLAGKGTSYKTGGLFKRYFTEHGFVFVFASALIRPAYWQGVPKIFSRMQRDEYYWPEFALLGEEPVFDKELFVDGSTTEDGVFGYVPRYSDYKSAVPEVHGDFRTSLDFWINPRKFANQPELNSEFIYGDPQKKMFAVQSLYSDSILITIRHNVKASRLMPFYGVPTI